MSGTNARGLGRVPGSRTLRCPVGQFVTAATDLVHQPRVRLAAALLMALALLTGGLVAQPSAGPPAPSSVLGFEPGEDYRLADFRQLRDYFRALDVQSERLIQHVKLNLALGVRYAP